LIQSVHQKMEGIRNATHKQAEGTTIVSENSSDSLELAQTVNRAAKEQSDCSLLIDASYQDVATAVHEIEIALQEQSTACQLVREHIMRVSEETQSNGTTAQHVAESVSNLSEQARRLQNHVARFRL